jgi:hypothetical protein
MKMDSKQIAAKIVRNVKRVNAGMITWDEFGKLNRATWMLADRGEPCVMGSECDKRVMAVRRWVERLSA